MRMKDKMRKQRPDEDRYDKRMAGCKEGAQEWKMTWARHGMALRWNDDTKIGWHEREMAGRRDNVGKSDMKEATA